MCGAGQELLLQQNLMRRLENGGKEPLMLEEGKAAVVNIKGPMLLHRQQLVSLSLSDFLDLVKVTPPPSPHNMGASHPGCDRPLENGWASQVQGQGTPKSAMRKQYKVLEHFQNCQGGPGRAFLIAEGGRKPCGSMPRLSFPSHSPCCIAPEASCSAQKKDGHVSAPPAAP